MTVMETMAVAVGVATILYYIERLRIERKKVKVLGS